MHNADPERSARLARTLRYLSYCAETGCTTAQLQAATASMAPATDVSELRQSGYLIECTNEGMNENGRRVYRYVFKGRTP
jgi:hypothetical protein